MKRKILIAGGTGFVGKALIETLVNEGFGVHVLTRQKTKLTKIIPYSNAVSYFYWDIKEAYIEREAFKGVDTIINLTGENIGAKRWSKSRKKELIESRTKSIDLLFKYVSKEFDSANNEYEPTTNEYDSIHNLKKCKNTIKHFISSSAVGYYGANTSSKIYQEQDKPGNDFLASVCLQWELAAKQFEHIGISTTILRKGVIIGPNGGMLKQVLPLAKLGVNTSLGHGEQYLAWVDLRDVLNVYIYILKNPELFRNLNIYNLVASEHILIKDFSIALLKAVGKKSILPAVPSFIIQILKGEMSVMLLNGSRVSNENLKASGFKFNFDTINKSLSTV